jgi:hypothetical protein
MLHTAEAGLVPVPRRYELGQQHRTDHETQCQQKDRLDRPRAIFEKTDVHLCPQHAAEGMLAPARLPAWCCAIIAPAKMPMTSSKTARIGRRPR